MSQALTFRPTPNLGEVDHEQNEPFRSEKIVEFMEELHQLSITILNSITSITSVNEHSWLTLRTYIDEQNKLFQLINSALNLEKPEDLARLFQRLKINTRDTQVYVRSFIGADIIDNILAVPNIDSALVAKLPQISVQSRPHVAEIVDCIFPRQTPEDRERIACLQKALRGDPRTLRQIGFFAGHTDLYATSYAEDLLDTLLPLLLNFKDDNHTKLTEMEWKRKELKKKSKKLMKRIFFVAYDLRDMMDQQFGSTYRFVWPRPGDKLCERRMDIESKGQRTARGAIDYNIIAATLLPAVIVFKGREETVLVKALVCVRNSDGDLLT